MTKIEKMLRREIRNNRDVITSVRKIWYTETARIEVELQAKEAEVNDLENRLELLNK